MAPKNIKISATLNAKGFEIPQQDTFRKSTTAPWKNRSTALPAAPPTRKPQEINPIDPKFSETDHLITIKQIKKAITTICKEAKIHSIIPCHSKLQIGWKDIDFSYIR